MSSKRRWLLVVLLLVMPLMVAAHRPDTPPAVMPQDGDGDTVELTEVFENTSGVTVQFPAGWAAQEDPDNAGIEIYNDPALLERRDDQDLKSGEAGVIILPGLPLEGMELTEVLALATDQSDEPGMTYGDIKAFKLDGIDAYRMDVADDTASGFLLTFEGPDDTVVLVAAVTAAGELADFEDTLLAIIASVEFPSDIAADGDTGDDSSLGASYTSANGLSFEYPKSWYMEEAATGLILVADREETMTADVVPDDGFSVILFHPNLISLLSTSTAPAEAMAEVLEALAAQDSDIVFGDAAPATLDGSDAARAESAGEFAGFALAFDMGDEGIGMIMVIAGDGGFALYEDTALAIAESMSIE